MDRRSERHVVLGCKFILTWYRRHPDHEGGSPKVRLSIALRLADPCEYPKCGYLGYIIFGSGGLRSRYPLL